MLKPLFGEKEVHRLDEPKENACEASVDNSWGSAILATGNPDTQGDYSKGQVRTPTGIPTVITLWGKTNGNTSRPR